MAQEHKQYGLFAFSYVGLCILLYTALGLGHKECTQHSCRAVIHVTNLCSDEAIRLPVFTAHAQYVPREHVEHVAGVCAAFSSTAGRLCLADMKAKCQGK